MQSGSADASSRALGGTPEKSGSLQEASALLQPGSAAASRPGSGTLAAPAPSPVPASPQPCASPDLTLRHRPPSALASSAARSAGQLQSGRQRSAYSVEPQPSTGPSGLAERRKPHEAGLQQRNSLTRARAAKPGPKHTGAGALNTYAKLSPVRPAPAPAPAPAPSDPAASAPQPRHGKTVRELGRELIKHHVESQHHGNSGAPRGSGSTLFYEYDIGQDGLPSGMQHILDAYTRIAGDVEKLTSIPRAPLVAGGSGAATPRHSLQASATARTRFARVPRPPLRHEASSARSSQRAYFSAPASAGPVRDGHVQGSLLPVRAGSQRSMGSQLASSSSFGLSSVLSSQHAPASSPEFGHTSGQHSTPATASPHFGLTSILKPGQARGGEDLGGRQQQFARQGQGGSTGSQSKAADAFDEGSWIYIMGSTTNSMSAKRLAQRQRAQQAASLQ